MADIHYVQESKRPCPTGSPDLRAARPVHRFGPGNRLRSSLLNRSVKAGFTRWQTPLGAEQSASRFFAWSAATRPKAGQVTDAGCVGLFVSGVPPQTPYPAAVGGGERGGDTTSLTGWPKGPMTTSSEDSAAGESFISLAS